MKCSLPECFRRRSKSVPSSPSLGSVYKKTTDCSMDSTALQYGIPKKKYRLVVMGATQSGKSAIVERFLGKHFDDRYFPTVESFHRKFYRLKETVYQLDIMDTSGHQPFASARKLSYMSGSIVASCDMFVVVAAVDNVDSIYHLHEVRKAIIEEKHSRGCHRKPAIVYLINKTDLPHHKWNVEDKQEINDVLKTTLGDLDDVFLTSAQEGTNIDEAFARLFTSRGCPRMMNPEVCKRSRDPSIDVQTKTSVVQKLKKFFVEQPPEVFVELHSRKPSFREEAIRHKASTCSMRTCDSLRIGSKRSVSERPPLLM